MGSSLTEAARSIDGALEALRAAKTAWEDMSTYRNASDAAKLVRRKTILLPPVFQQNYFEYKSFMGLFPEIGRAWLTADSRLYLWSYEDGKGGEAGVLSGDLYAYEALDQIIVSVALVRPVKGVFIDEIEWLVAVATPVEVVLLGVSLDPATNTLTLTQTDIVVSTDNVLMLKIVGTPGGRIFMAGYDGQLHELSYSSTKSSALTRFLSAGNPRKRARRRTHSQSLLSSFLIPQAVRSYFLAGAELIDLAYDEERNCLYSVSQSGIISLYLVKNTIPGTPLQYVTSVNAAADANRHARSAPGAEREFVAIFPTSSPTVHLVAITSYGERIYYSTYASHRPFSFSFASGTYADNNATSSVNASANDTNRDNVSPTVSGLREVGWRGSVPAMSVSSPGSRLCVHIALWDNGSILMSDLRETESDVLIGVFPESCSTVGSQIDVGPSSQQIYNESRRSEIFTETSLGNYGDTSNIVRTFGLAKAGRIRGEVCESLDFTTSGSNAFWVLTGKAIVLYERKRPAEVLKEILISEGDAARFFLEYGVAQSSAMCLELAVADPSIAPSAARAYYIHGESISSNNAIPETTQGVSASAPYYYQPQVARHQRGFPISPVFDVGRPASIALSHERFSGVHDGLALYLAKVLSPLWNAYILSARDIDAYPKLSITKDSLSVIRSHLLAAITFLEEYVPESMFESMSGGSQNKFRMGNAIPSASSYARGTSLRSPAEGVPASAAPTIQDRVYRGLHKLKKSNEKRRIEYFATLGLKNLASRSAEAIALVLILNDHQLHRTLPNTPRDVREIFCNMRYCDLIAGEAGSFASSSLLESLFSSYADEPSAVDNIGSVLHERCPSYFGKDDRTLHRGLALLRQAVKQYREATKILRESGATGSTSTGPFSAVNDSRSAALTKAEEAVNILSDVAGRITNLRAICQELSEVGAFSSLITISLSVANAAEASANKDAVEDAHRSIFSFLTSLLDSSTTEAEQGERPAGSDQMWDRAEAKDAALRAAFSSPSDSFHIALYEFLLNTPNGEAELLKHPSARVLKVLEKPGREHLLWRYLAQQGRHAEAAEVLLRMADADEAGGRGASLSDRLNYLSCAVHNAKTAMAEGNRRASAILAEASDLLDVAQVQMRLRNKLRSLPAEEARTKAIDDLGGKIMNLSTLYNNYANPMDLRENCLDILNCAKHEDEALILDTWRKLLEEETQAGVEAVVVDKIASLGRTFYPGVAFRPGCILRLLAEEAFSRKWSYGALWSAMNRGGVPWGNTIDGFRSLLETGLWVTEEKLLWLSNTLIVGLDKADVRGRDKEAAHGLIVGLKARLRAVARSESEEVLRRLEAAGRNWDSIA